VASHNNEGTASVEFRLNGFKALKITLSTADSYHRKSSIAIILVDLSANSTPEAMVIMLPGGYPMPTS